LMARYHDDAGAVEFMRIKLITNKGFEVIEVNLDLGILRRLIRLIHDVHLQGGWFKQSWATRWVMMHCAPVQQPLQQLTSLALAIPVAASRNKQTIKLFAISRILHGTTLMKTG